MRGSVDLFMCQKCLDCDCALQARIIGGTVPKLYEALPLLVAEEVRAIETFPVLNFSPPCRFFHSIG